MFSFGSMDCRRKLHACHTLYNLFAVLLNKSTPEYSN
jgi:hypothetical protein